MHRPTPRREPRFGLRSSHPPVRSVSPAPAPSTPSTTRSKVAAPTSNKRRSVHFGTVEVTKFPVTLGDHPCCSKGPAMELSWKPENRKALTIGLDEYESFRRLTRRQNPQQLRLSSSERRKRLGIRTKRKPRSRGNGTQPKQSELEKKLDSLNTMIKCLDVKLKSMEGCDKSTMRKQVAAKCA